MMMPLSARSNLLTAGSPAPDFTCALSDGGQITLSEWRGRQRVVLVFYPGDNTPVCTAQLCAFRDDWQGFEAQDTQVYGVNPADMEKHARFAQRQHLPFPLLVDTGGKIAATYGCRLLFGLIRRTVYVIDKQGRVAFAERGNPTPAALLRVLADLQDETPTAP